MARSMFIMLLLSGTLEKESSGELDEPRLEVNCKAWENNQGAHVRKPKDESKGKEVG